MIRVEILPVKRNSGSMQMKRLKRESGRGPLPIENGDYD